jgi:hypothetical protein
MTPLRKRILALARRFNGAIMTADQVMELRATLGSMDDTLSDDEVFMFLSHLAEGRPPEIMISALPRNSRLVKVHVDNELKVTTSAAPFSRS